MSGGPYLQMFTNVTL